jgi:hypothetical protein
MALPKDTFNFNNQDYEFVVRIYNGIHDVYLNNTIWEDLILEEDIFDWKIKGSITIKSPYESFERPSALAIAAAEMSDKKLVYKFRNDGRDTVFITIKPIIDPKSKVVLPDKLWRLELEAIIYDVEDLPSPGITDKNKKLYFWEKTYQMMTEKDCDFTTATTGPNRGLANISQQSNTTRSQTVGSSVAELLKNDEDFTKHSKLTDTAEWDKGSSESKIFYSAPIGSKFIDTLNYLMNYTVSSAADDHQPCILKMERAETSLSPKQFSLKSIKKYFEKAGNTIDAPKEYQNEHFFIYEHSADQKEITAIKKAPLNMNEPIKEFKGDEINSIRGYQLVDISSNNYSHHLANYRVSAFNSTAGQFSEEGTKHGVEEYKKFFRDSIKPFIVTRNIEDRLVLTPFIEKKLNTKTVLSLRNDEMSRLADGRNRMLKHYLFSNLAISFTVQGSTHRQTGRFFGVSKRTGNFYEHDHKVEGQYFVTNIVHHFSNADKKYSNQLIGVKTHTYMELADTTFTTDDVMIIK